MLSLPYRIKNLCIYRGAGSRHEEEVWHKTLKLAHSINRQEVTPYPKS